MAYEYTVQQLNYQHSYNADDYTEDSKLAEMTDQGWEVENSDVSSWPYVTILWRREKDAPADKPVPPVTATTLKARSKTTE
jgi:hypothetical protein